ncbi:MAG: DUF4430 domain-containing protein [Conexivisphaerales archaeon]
MSEGRKFSASLFYGVAAILLAMLVIAGSIAALYYAKYSSEEGNYASLVQQSQSLQKSLQNLNSNYTALLGYYNKTLLLLANSASQLNTSSQAYANISQELPLLWKEYQRLYASVAELPKADILVEFGNGTRIWYNVTYQPGWNLYIATLVALNGKIDAIYYPSFGEHFVTGIAGVENNQTASWFLWTYNGSWQMANVGADDIIVSSGSSYAWTFCTYNPATYQPNCSP